MLNFVKRATLYIRVSSEEQARHDLSLGEQHEDLAKYTTSHNYAVARVYADSRQETAARSGKRQFIFRLSRRE